MRVFFILAVAVFVFALVDLSNVSMCVCFVMLVGYKFVLMWLVLMRWWMMEIGDVNMRLFWMNIGVALLVFVLIFFGYIAVDLIFIMVLYCFKICWIVFEVVYGLVLMYVVVLMLVVVVVLLDVNKFVGGGEIFTRRFFLLSVWMNGMNLMLFIYGCNVGGMMRFLGVC